jgi:hypothetical protein
MAPRRHCVWHFRFWSGGAQHAMDFERGETRKPVWSPQASPCQPSFSCDECKMDWPRSSAERWCERLQRVCICAGRELTRLEGFVSQNDIFSDGSTMGSKQEDPLRQICRPPRWDMPSACYPAAAGAMSSTQLNDPRPRGEPCRGAILRQDPLGVET